MTEPSLELLQTLIERLLGQQREMTAMLIGVERRLERVERALLAGHRLLLDRTETDTDIQHALDALTRRVQALEENDDAPPAA